MQTLYRLIPAKWASNCYPIEGKFTFDEILSYNERGYNVYTFPNQPSVDSYNKIPVNPKSKTGRKRFLTGEYVDVFEWCFVDLDMKHYNDGSSESHNYATKDDFIVVLLSLDLPPTKIVDSGGGIHAYWRVKDLDAKSFLRLNRRLMRFLNTDRAVTNLEQLMRVPGTLNVKDPDNFKLCETILEEPSHVYSCEQLDRFLPPIQVEDEEYCVRHYDTAYNQENSELNVSEELPLKFLKLAKTNPEIKALFYEPQKDRSQADFRLGHLLQAGGLTAEEARPVLMQTAKATERTKTHRYSYATNIIEKIWDKEVESSNENTNEFKILSKTMAQLLSKSPTDCEKNTRFPCHPVVDATEHGFRLSEVLGLVGGAGNGKTSFSLNLFYWFIERNPEYIHLYVTLEQPEKEISAKWHKMTKDSGQEGLVDKVHVLGNYNEDGTYRNLSLSDIQEYVLGLEKHLGKKVGACVIDHIGILKQEKKSDEISGLIGVCKGLKAFAIATNCFLLIQSQTTREKNGGGDMELNMDAAFGTSQFENYVDYIFTVWQPLKRVYARAPHMTVNAFKMCKNRHKNQLKDFMKLDEVYALMFDPNTDRLRELTSDENKAYDFWNVQATSIRNRDKKKEPSQITVIDWVKKESKK